VNDAGKGRHRGDHDKHVDVLQTHSSFLKVMVPEAVRGFCYGILYQSACQRFLVPMRLTLKSINDKLAKRGHMARLAKGGGYFYFQFGEAAEWWDRTVNVSTVNSLSLDQWLGEFERLKRVNEGIWARVTQNGNVNATCDLVRCDNHFPPALAVDHLFDMRAKRFRPAFSLQPNYSFREH
jgi:hypothetical protein